MDQYSRTSSLFAVFIAVVSIGLVAILVGDGEADAANPPTSIFTSAMIDPSEPPPDNDLETDDETPVLAIAEANGRYYVGGDFGEVGGESQVGLVAIEVATGQVDPNFRPVITGSDAAVFALAVSPDSQDLFIAGKFLNVNGTFRERVAKLDAITGAVDLTFAANTSAAVETIVTDGTSVWIGGAFPDRLQKLDAVTGALDGAWTGTADGTVLDIELSGNTLWVGGNFSNISGQAVPFLAPLDKDTGTVDAAWVPQYPEDQKILALSPSPDGSVLYVGTAGTPSDQGNAIRAYTPDGTVLWERTGAGDVQAIEATATTVYGGTHGQWQYIIQKTNIDNTPNNGKLGEDSDLTDTPFPASGYKESPTNTNAVRREKFFSLNAADGAILPWDPYGNSTDGVWELTSGPSGLLSGGDFRTILNPTGTAGQELALFSPHFAVFAGLGNAGGRAPEPLFTVDCAGTACNFDASMSQDDGTISAYNWDFGDGQTATGVAASAVLGNNTTHNITLSVTDNAGLTAARTQKAVVGNGGLPITHIGTNSDNTSNNQLTAEFPATAQNGDVAFAFISVTNNGTTVNDVPAGWTPAGDEVDGNLRTFVFWKSLEVGDPGTDVTFRLSTSLKADLTMATFRGVDGTNPIVTSGFGATTQRQSEHVAPELTFDGDATLLHYWAERTSASTEFFASPEVATLSMSIGTGNARINTTLGLDPTLRTAASPKRVAVAEHHGATALGWSLAIAAGPPVSDTTPPVVGFTTATSQSVGIIDVDGTVTDDLSGVDRVRTSIKKLSTGEFWNGTTWVSTWSWNLATLNGDDTWTQPNVNLDTPGDYRVLIWAWDNQNNKANYTTNPQPTITVAGNDTTPPVVTFTTSTSQSVGDIDIDGGVTDDLSGVDRVRVNIKKLSTGEFWNGTQWGTPWSWNLATLNGNDTWTLPQVDLDTSGDYRVLLWAWDNQNNRADYTINPQPTITVT